MPRRPRRPLSAKSYGFTLLAANGGPAPGGGIYANDFEPGGLNSRGQYSYAADVSTGGEASSRARHDVGADHPLGDPAPGGGTFGPFGIFGHAALNDPGDLAFAFNGDPFTLPLGLNSGVYRFTASSNATTAILVPFVTPAPTGGVFQGTVHPRQHQQRPRRRLRRDHQHDGGDLRPPNLGLGMGVFMSDHKGALTSVVVPGDPAPRRLQLRLRAEPLDQRRGRHRVRRSRRV